MKMVLIHEELWEYVEKETSDDKKGSKALARIALSVQPSVIPYIRTAKSAYEAWNNLKDTYEGKGLCRKLGLLRSLFGTKLADSNSMDGYLNKIKEVAHQLSEIESPLDDEFIAVIILSGLTSDYDPLIMAIENSGQKLTTEHVSAKLLQETQRRQDKEDGVTALVTRKQIKCFRCKRAGHYSSNCTEKKAYHEKQTTKHEKPKSKALVTALSVKVHSNVWYIDSGATNHMCNSRDMMVSCNPNKTVDVSVANGERLSTAGLGEVEIKLKDCVRTISETYYVPNLSTNLLSVSAMTRKGYEVTFNRNSCTIRDGNEVLATGTQVNGVYQLDTVSDNASTAAGNAAKVEECELVAATAAASTPQELWHRRLGHLNARSMNLLRKGMAVGVDYKDTDYKHCIPCIEGKQSRQPFPKRSFSRASDVLELVHTDLCGPMQVPSLSGSKYTLSFIDDYTRKQYTYFLKSKDETFRYFQEFKQLVENETGKKIKVLRSDRGGEYMSSIFQEFLKANGIKHQKTIPDSPQQNGVAERANRTIMEKVRCMLMDAGLGMKFWAEAVNTAVYLKNRSPTKAVLGATPEEKWSKKKVNLNNLKVFGCIAYVMVKNRKKLDQKSKPYIFMGYSEESKGYRLIDPTNPRDIKHSRDVVFLEDKFYVKDMSHDDTVDQQLFVDINLNENVIPQSESSTVDTDISDDRQSQNINRISTITLDDSESEDSINEGPDDRLDTTYVPGRESLAEAELTSDSSYDDVAESPLRANFVRLADHDPDEPQTATEALNGPEADGWRKAMKDEYDSFIKNKCWTLTERDPEHKPVKCKWVYKKKYGLNGELLKFKARLVAKGYSQQYGIDYQETFSPVVRYSTIRMLLALSAEYNMSIDHLDVKTAFLNGELEETVYMEQPEGFEVPGSENMVYKLNKAVYGLKQASKSWYDKITKVLCDKLDFSRLSSEPCVYFKYDKNDSRSMMIIALYVDDLIVFTSPEFQGKEEIKRKLQNEFDITDLGPAQHILGMKLSRKGNNISLDQSNYIEKLLKKYRMEECKPVGTPMETGLKLTKESQSNDTYDYRGLIGSLMYVAVSTRPDISHAVSYLSQFNNCFGESHWKAAKRILRYLKGTINLGLTFYKSGLDITAYADADWASDNHDRRSYTGYVFCIGDSIVSWESRKQRTVALSSTEAEYMALSDTCKESLFIRKFMLEMFGITPKICIFNDNQSAIKLCKNFMFHSRTKHIDIRHHFIKEIVNNGIVQVRYLSTNDMLADVLTKALCKEKHCKFVNLMLK